MWHIKQDELIDNRDDNQKVMSDAKMRMYEANDCDYLVFILSDSSFLFYHSRVLEREAGVVGDMPRWRFLRYWYGLLGKKLSKVLN